MSDTWQTIKTHSNLRKKLFERTETQYLISVPMRTFKATVNTGIYLFKKSAVDKAKDNFIIAADFHNLDIKNGDLEAGFDMLTDINNFDETKDGYTIISDREMAIYTYKQKIIGNYSNLSYFIASPKLFKLMQDVDNLKPKTYTDGKGNPVIFDTERQKNLFEKDEPNIYLVDFNNKKMELAKLGDIAKVVVGLQTGDTKYYIRQLPDARGSYKEIDLNLVLKEEELEKIRNDEKLRMDVINNGICTNPEHKTRQHRYFGGRYFIPYDKGGASDIDEGWLPNYYVPTPYFIDWSEKAVKRLKIWKRPGTSKIASRFQNKEFYFKEGITFSHTGQYSPTFRMGASGPFDVAGSSLFLNQDQKLKKFVGIIGSKICKYFLKAFINHSVNMSEDPIKQMPIVFNISEDYRQKLTNLVSSIIHHQKQNPCYDYMTNEQVEIDKLVYEMYNLNEEDIKEVENWYFRRYPKLAWVIEEKLKEKNNGG
jgi:hypothetical protein